MPSGFSSLNRIDLITHDAKNDEFVLIIVHAGEWDASLAEENLFLQKVNGYLHFVVDGEFYQRYPQAKGKKIRLQIDSGANPPTNIRTLISEADREVMARSIRVVFNLIEAKSS